MFDNLTVFTGPMFSGKTENLLKEVLWSSFFVNEKTTSRCLVIKPSMDIRYSESDIVSHDGASAAALPVSDLGKVDFTKWEKVFIDEVQFFEDPWVKGDLVSHIHSGLLAGTHVFAAGLDLDYRGVPFDVTARIIAMSGNVHRLSAVCSRCGSPAHFTGKSSLSALSDFFDSEGRVEIGSNDRYSALCQIHWMEHFKRASES